MSKRTPADAAAYAKAAHTVDGVRQLAARKARLRDRLSSEPDLANAVLGAERLYLGFQSTADPVEPDRKLKALIKATERIIAALGALGHDSLVTLHIKMGMPARCDLRGTLTALADAARAQRRPEHRPRTEDLRVVVSLLMSDWERITGRPFTAKSCAPPAVKKSCRRATVKPEIAFLRTAIEYIDATRLPDLDGIVRVIARTK